MTTKDQQLAFAKGFGVIPSIQSAPTTSPSSRTTQPFVNRVKYACGVVRAPGITDVLTDVNAQLEGLNNTDPKTILDSVQENLTAEMGS